MVLKSIGKPLNQLRALVDELFETHHAKRGHAAKQLGNKEAGGARYACRRDAPVMAHQTKLAPNCGSEWRRRSALPSRERFARACNGPFRKRNVIDILTLLPISHANQPLSLLCLGIV